MTTQTIALGIEYDGSAFHGFQSQSNVPTVQDTLEAAIGRIAASPVRVAAAGRTDAGVHATQQVVSFETAADRPLEAWRRGVNSRLPDSVCVVWAVLAPDRFNARFDAIWRRYVYVFGERDTVPALGFAHATWIRERLDESAMHLAAQVLVGEHDFTSFRAAQCQARGPYRRVHAVSVRRFGHLVAVDITANAFLLHMVRNIAGALSGVGRGEIAVHGLRDLLMARDRNRAPPTAPAKGLYLVGVGYPTLEVDPRPRTPAILGPLVLD